MRGEKTRGEEKKREKSGREKEKREKTGREETKREKENEKKNSASAPIKRPSEGGGVFRLFPSTSSSQRRFDRLRQTEKKKKYLRLYRNTHFYTTDNLKLSSVDPVHNFRRPPGQRTGIGQRVKMRLRSQRRLAWGKLFTEKHRGESSGSFRRRNSIH